MLPYLTESFGNPSSAHAFGRAARAGARRRPRAGRPTAQRRGSRDRLHVGRDGGQQPGAQGRGVGRARRAATGSSPRRSSITRSGTRCATSRSSGSRSSSCRSIATGGSTPTSSRRRSTTRRSSSRSCWPTTRSARSSRSPRSPRASAPARASLFHVDAVQAAPYVDLDVDALGADLVSLGAHKFEGPKGVGALYVRHGTHILAQQQGGTQERHRRAGTENVAGAVGLATAYELACAERPETVARLRRQRDRLAAAVLAVPGVEPTGHPKDRLPGLFSMVARDTDGASVAMSLDLEGIACSVGSACTTGSTEVSHVLTAMGYPEEEARGALRLSLGRTTTDDEIAVACDVVPRVVASMRLGTRRRRGRSARAGCARVSRILVAMSGGVDSSVAAALLHEQGHEVVGVWMRLHDVADTYSEFKKSCCSLDAADDARRVAAQLGHPVLRHEPRARVRRRRAAAVPRRVPRRPDAVAVRRLQHVREVRGAARPGPPPVRVRGGRDRSLRAAGRRAGRSGAAAAGARRGQGPDVLPVRPAPGPARARAVPARAS